MNIQIQKKRPTQYSVNLTNLRHYKASDIFNYLAIELLALFNHLVPTQAQIDLAEEFVVSVANTQFGLQTNTLTQLMLRSRKILLKRPALRQKMGIQYPH